MATVRMSLRFFNLSILLMILAANSVGQSITGTYESPEGSSVIIKKDINSARYTFTVGDVSVRAKNVESVDFTYCLLFNDLDLIIPKSMSVNNQSTCSGSKVNIEGFYSKLEVDGHKLKDIWIISTTNTGGLTAPDGKEYKRPRAGSSYKLYYSLTEGLVGFNVNKVNLFRNQP